jgi:ankyrin repeat protein
MGNTNKSPLTYALNEGKSDIAELLLEYNASL